MKRIIQIIPYLIAIILAILLFRQCDKVSYLKNKADSEQDFLNDSIRYYKNELGQEIALKTALQGDKNTLEILLSKQIDSTGQLKRLVKKFRNLDAAGNVTTITKIDSIPIPYEVPIPCKFHREWEKKTRWYEIAGQSDQNGITIDNLTVPNTISFAIGKKKKGWFDSEYVIETVNSNPNISTIGLDSYSIKLPKKRFGVSLFAGFGLSGSGLSPTIGIGIGYNLIEF